MEHTHPPIVHPDTVAAVYARKPSPGPVRRLRVPHVTRETADGPVTLPLWLDVLKPADDAARCVWVTDADVTGTLTEGSTVTAKHPLDDFCLRRHDGSTPIAPGSRLTIVETRSWGAAMAQET